MLYLPAGWKLHDKSKKITTKIEKSFSNHFPANKINVSQEKYSNYAISKATWTEKKTITETKLLGGEKKI